MSELIFKTRGGFSPQGLPKVYLCCHRADLARYAAPVTKQLLKAGNYAVFYYEGEPAEDWQTQLRQMQLLVLPVTTRLLRETCHAMEAFSFAVENHIPVLPLMQEPGLEQLFNEVCGDLQFLDPHAADATALAFDDKLKTYLDSVLVGDELAQQVRTAFRGYIFLSYRKKDRKYAHQLMELVHGYDFCRDIAIWYDEFLVPGEDFNENIRHYLSRSDLFLLNVTPNLVCEENYVAAYEYPAARAQGKPILPVETVPTDGALLQQIYPQIPAPIPAGDGALDAALAACFGEDPSEEDPRTQYHLGLAYLSGIDVEVDHEKAAQLITAAAEADLLDAITKLVQMYQSGQGVARDYFAAITWQEQKIKLLGDRYAEDASEENLIALWDVLMKCGEAYQNVGDRKQTLEMYRAAEELLSNYAPEDCSSGIMKSNLATAHNRLGKLYRTWGELHRARQHFEKASKIHADLALNHSRSSADKENGLINQMELVSVWVELERPQSLEILHMDALQKLATETGSVAATVALANSCSSLGRISRERGDYALAQQCYEQLVKLRTDLAEAEDTPGKLHDLLTATIDLADVCCLRGDTAAAIKLYDSCIERAEAIFAETEAMQAYLDLATCYLHLSRCYHQRKEGPQARISCRIAQETLEPLITGKVPVPVLELYAQVLQMQAELADDREEALEKASCAVGFLNKAASIYDSGIARARVAEAWCFLAKMELQCGKNKYARISCDISLDWLEKTRSEDADLRNKLIDIRKALADVLLQIGKRKQAEALLRENLQICRYAILSFSVGIDMLPQLPAIGSILPKLLESYHGLVDLLMQQHRYEEAQQYLETGIQIADRFPLETLRFTCWESLLDNDLIIGLRHFQNGKPELAKKALETYIRKAPDLLKLRDDTSRHMDLLLAYDRMAMIYSESDRDSEAYYLRLLLEEGKILASELDDDACRRMIEAVLTLCDTDKDIHPERITEYLRTASIFWTQLSPEKREFILGVQLARHMGEDCLRRGDREGAKENFEYGLGPQGLLDKVMARAKPKRRLLRSQAVWTADDLRILQALIQCSGRLGQLLQQEKRWVKAAEYWEITENLCRTYLKTESLDLVENYLARAVSALGVISDELGKPAEATAYLNEAYALWKKTGGWGYDDQESYGDVCLYLARRKPEAERIPLVIEAFSRYKVLLESHPEMAHCREKLEIAEEELQKLKKDRKTDPPA